MKEKYENLLERQHAVEEKIEQLEQQLEISMEALESILDHLGPINEAITRFTEAESRPKEPFVTSVAMPWPGWEPLPRGKPKKNVISKK
jgi:cell division septum initiation protein DivIVA